MRAVGVMAMFLGLAAIAAAEEPVQRHEWATAQVASLDFAKVVEEDGRAVLEVTSAADGGTYQVARLDATAITATRYAVRGQVRYEKVEGKGLLEMWSVLDDGSRYFTRTLAPAGPMAPLTGSSPWRAFELPFDLGDSGRRPRSLEISVVLPGGGKVWLAPLEVIQQ